MLSKEKSNQRKVMYKSMYRWSLLTTAVLIAVIVGYYLIVGDWESITADPFAVLADIFVRSMVGPLIAIPFVLNRYRGKMNTYTYIGEHDSFEWGIATVIAIVIAVVTAVVCAAVYESTYTSAETMTSIGFVISCCVLGAAYAIVRAFPILVAAQVIGCSLVLLFDACGGLKVCGYFLAFTLASFGVMRIFVFIYDALTDPGEVNDTVKRIYKGIEDWLWPEFKEKT